MGSAAAPLIVTGGVLKAYGDYNANMEQAKSELENAQFYEAQSIFAREAMSREARLARAKYSTAMGMQKGAFARGGVSISEGSSVGVLASTLASQVEELLAVRKKGELEASLAGARAAQARRVAGRLRSFEYNLAQAAGTALTTTAAAGGI